MCARARADVCIFFFSPCSCTLGRIEASLRCLCNRGRFISSSLSLTLFSCFCSAQRTPLCVALLMLPCSTSTQHRQGVQFLNKLSLVDHLLSLHTRNLCVSVIGYIDDGIREGYYSRVNNFELSFKLPLVTWSLVVSGPGCFDYPLHPSSWPAGFSLSSSFSPSHLSFSIFTLFSPSSPSFMAPTSYSPWCRRVQLAPSLFPNSAIFYRCLLQFIKVLSLNRVHPLKEAVG